LNAAPLRHQSRDRTHEDPTDTSAKGRHGDAANANPTGVGHNFRLVLAWLKLLLLSILIALRNAAKSQPILKSAS
jgi:hypothetical protein